MQINCSLYEIYILRHVIFDGSAPALILRVTDHDEEGFDAGAE